jgi:vacuolar-type H+-ATPase subunit E/Vma4
MAIEDIFRALEEQADFEVNQILHSATVQSDSIEREAREEAERITQARIASAEEAVRTKAAKSVNAARLQVRRDQAAVRDAAVDDVFGLAARNLAAMHGTKEYERIFAALAREALAGVDSECMIQVLPGDAALAEKVASELGARATVDPSLEGLGGIVVSTHGGRVVRRNTFESRLQKVRVAAGAKVAEVLTS